MNSVLYGTLVDILVCQLKWECWRVSVFCCSFVLLLCVALSCGLCFVVLASGLCLSVSHPFQTLPHSSSASTVFRVPAHVWRINYTNPDTYCYYNTLC